MVSEFSFPRPGESIIVAGSPLVCEEYLRLLPQRRLACKASWQGKSVFVKLYHRGAAGGREWRKECTNYQLLFQREIETPALLFSGVSDNGEFFILITEWLRDVVTIEDAWKEQDRESLVEKIATHLADQHEAGMLQEDLHADNLVYLKARILTLDYGHVIVRSSPISRSMSLNNLALILIQLHPMQEGLAKKALQEYMGQRGWNLTERDRRHFDNSTERGIRKIKKKTEAKIFRSCTAFAVGGDGKWSWVYDRSLPFGGRVPSLNWEAEIRIADSVAKYEEKSYRSEIQGLKGEPVIGVWFPPRWVLKRLLPTGNYLPSECAWIKAQALNYQNIPMEYPVAHLLRSAGLLRKRGVLCARRREGVALGHFFKSEGISYESKEKAARNLLRILDLLRWTMIGMESLDSSIRVDGEEPYFPAPYNITIHENRALARRQTADAWRSFSRRFAQQPELLELFESLGFSRLLNDVP